MTRINTSHADRNTALRPTGRADAVRRRAGDSGDIRAIERAIPYDPTSPVTLRSGEPKAV